MQFVDLFKDIRRRLLKPDDYMYVLHTPVGQIKVADIQQRVNSDLEYAFVHGRDENDKERLVCFTNAQLLSFPLELKLEKDLAQAARPIGFVNDKELVTVPTKEA